MYLQIWQLEIGMSKANFGSLRLTCRIWPRAGGLIKQLFSGEAIRIELDERRGLPVSICRLRPSRLGLVWGSLAATDEDGQTSSLVQGAFA